MNLVWSVAARLHYGFCAKVNTVNAQRDSLVVSEYTYQIRALQYTLHLIKMRKKEQQQGKKKECVCVFGALKFQLVAVCCFSFLCLSFFSLRSQAHALWNCLWLFSLTLHTEHWNIQFHDTFQSVATSFDHAMVFLVCSFRLQFCISTSRYFHSQFCGWSTYFCFCFVRFKFQ